MDILSHKYNWTDEDRQRSRQAKLLAYSGGFHIHMDSRIPELLGKEVGAEVLFIGCDHYLNFGVRLPYTLKQVTPRPEVVW